jgi:hypothetical protein
MVLILMQMLMLLLVLMLMLILISEKFTCTIFINMIMNWYMFLYRSGLAVKTSFQDLLFSKTH